MEPARPAVSAEARAAMYRRELTDRAALFYRLGYPIERAIARLQANADWDFEVGTPRPAKLDATAIAALVEATYARRPGH